MDVLDTPVLVERKLEDAVGSPLTVPLGLGTCCPPGFSLHWLASQGGTHLGSFPDVQGGLGIFTGESFCAWEGGGIP